jgi:hypothetical protein
MASEGEVWRGVEKMIPKATKDVMQAFRFANDGAETMKGDKLVEEFAPWELAGKAVGFTPSELASRYDENRANKDREKRILERRRKLMGQVAEARMELGQARKAGDTDAADTAQETIGSTREAIQRFNTLNPGMRITRDSLDRSTKSRMTAREMAQNGVFLNRKIPTRYDYATETD